MSTKSSDGSSCSCLSDDANIVDYSEAEHILQDVEVDLKSIQNQVKTDLAKTCLDHTARACKVTAILVRLQSADSRLNQIMNLMGSKQPRHADDLVSNFGMSVKLDMARSKLNGLKGKHAELRREWHSQEQHLNKIAGDVAKKEHELKYQSVFCTTQGYVLSKMLWKSSKCDGLLDLMVGEEKLLIELIKTLDGCLYAFTQTYKDEMPESTAEEYQYVLSLCGVLSNLASIPDGRFFLTNEPICREVYDQIIKALPKIIVPKAESLKWIMLVAIYNIMICKEGRDYAKSNRYLLRSLSECINPPHSNKIIILALKIIGHLTNDPNKAYVAHVGSVLPVQRLVELQQSKDSCTIRQQAKHILSNMETEELLHTIQLEQSKSGCNSACTQTFKKKNQELCAYYVFTDNTNTRTSGYTSSTTSSSRTESDDYSGYDPSVSAKSEIEGSGSFPRSKSSQRPQTHSAPSSFYDRRAMESNPKSISAYNTRRRARTPSPLSSAEHPSSSCIYLEDASSTLKGFQEPLSGLTFSSNSGELGYNRVPMSTVTPMSTYVDSMMLAAISSSNKKVKLSSKVASIVAPASTYVESRMLSGLSSSNRRRGNRVPEPVSSSFSYPAPYGTSARDATVTPASTFVDSSMLQTLSSFSRRTNRLPDSGSQATYCARECIASPMSTHVDPSMFASSSKRITGSPINVKFNEHPSTLCHPSVWSLPANSFNTFQEPTPSRSGEMPNLQCQAPQLDINKLLAITIGDHLQNPSATRRNAGNNTFADGQSNPSIVTMFRISKSQALLSPDTSASPFCDSVSTNTSCPGGATVEDFFRIKNKNIGTTSKTSRRRVSNNSPESKTSEPKSPEPFDIAYGGYESYYENLKKESDMPQPTNVEKVKPQLNYENDINMPSTSKGYYGYETLNPFAIYPDSNLSSSSMVAQKRECSVLTETDQEKETGTKPKGTLGNIPESQNSEKCSPVQSTWECHACRGRTKPKKRPLFRIYDFGRKKRR